MNHAKALESRLQTNNEKLINYGYTTSDTKSACSAQHFGDYLKDWVETFLYVINFRMCEKQPQLPLKISVLVCKFHFRFLLLSGFMGFEESKSQFHCLPFLLQMAGLEFVSRGKSDNM